MLHITSTTYKKLDYHICDYIMKHERYTLHHQSYITERDFQIIQAMGLQFVRLPIPYFLFDEDPYEACNTYVDQAFT